MTVQTGWGEGYFVAAQDWPSRHQLGLTTDQIYTALGDIDDYYDATVASLKVTEQPPGMSAAPPTIGDGPAPLT
jgi:hypothetical protein